jgi:hypothetical protein
MGMARVVMLLSLGVNLGIGAAWAQKWIEYRPAGAGYRVEMPGSPEPAEQDVPTPAGKVRYHAARVMLGDTTFVAIHMDYPPVAVPSVEAALDGVRTGQLQDDGVLRDERRLTISGVPARRIVFDKDDRVVSTLFALRGYVLYQMLCTGPKGTDTSDDVRRFMSSFALVAR